MILYHGSNIAIDTPDLSKSKPFKDFGQGFYLSANELQARRMAEQRTALNQIGSPTVTRFLFDEDLMHTGELKVLTFDNYCEEWAEFVLKNRDMHQAQPSHDFDIVFGPIADDGVTFQLRRYKSGAITLPELVKELRFSQGITFQYYFGTNLAISKLKRL